MISTALIFLDVQELFFQGKKAVYNATNLIDILLYLEKQAHSSLIPIIYARQTNKSSLRINTDSWQLHSKFNPTENDLIIDKKDNDIFTELAINEFLNLNKIDTVIIAGLVSKCCVRATCMGAKDNNYRTILTLDGHSDFRKDSDKIIENVNNEMKEYGVILKKANEIVF